MRHRGDAIFPKLKFGNVRKFTLMPHHELQRELAILEHDPQPFLGRAVERFDGHGLLPFAQTNHGRRW